MISHMLKNFLSSKICLHCLHLQLILFMLAIQSIHSLRFYHYLSKHAMECSAYIYSNIYLRITLQLTSGYHQVIRYAFAVLSVSQAIQFFKIFQTLIEQGSWMLLESGGKQNQPTPSRSPQNTVKNQKNYFAFLKVHNELGKVMKSGTSKLLFSW